MPLISRLTNTGTIFLNGAFDEITQSTISLTPSTYFSSGFDEVSLNAGSIYFDGTGDYLNVTSSSLFPSTSTTPFTLEAWVYPTASSGGYIITNAAAPSSVKYCFMLGTSPDNASGTKVVFGRFTGSWSYLASATSVSTNKWTHIACVFTGSTCQIYINGTLDASGGATTWNTGGTNELRIGYRWDEYAPGAPFYFTGYISNVRIAVGSAVYSAAFSVNQSVLDNITNTQLLLNVLNSENFARDGSNNNFTLTVNGNTSWNTLGPFNQGVTGLKQRQLRNGQLQISGIFDEYSGVS